MYVVDAHIAELFQRLVLEVEECPQDAFTLRGDCLMFKSCFGPSTGFAPNTCGMALTDVAALAVAAGAPSHTSPSAVSSAQDSVSMRNALPQLCHSAEASFKSHPF